MGKRLNVYVDNMNVIDFYDSVGKCILKIEWNYIIVVMVLFVFFNYFFLWKILNLYVWFRLKIVLKVLMC